jgi:hypothetical protein
VRFAYVLSSWGAWEGNVWMDMYVLEISCVHYGWSVRLWPVLAVVGVEGWAEPMADETDVDWEVSEVSAKTTRACDEKWEYYRELMGRLGWERLVRATGLVVLCYGKWFDISRAMVEQAWQGSKAQRHSQPCKIFQDAGIPTLCTATRLALQVLQIFIDDDDDMSTASYSLFAQAEAGRQEARGKEVQPLTYIG